MDPIYGGYAFFFRHLSAEKLSPPIQFGRGYIQLVVDTD